jgi:hypothetical protein
MANEQGSAQCPIAVNAVTCGSGGQLVKELAKVSWNGAPRRVIVPFIARIPLRTVAAERVAFFGIRALKGGKFHPKLNMTTRLIANKYREGKAKRTLKRELKVLEIVKGEANIALECA